MNYIPTESDLELDNPDMIDLTQSGDFDAFSSDEYDPAMDLVDLRAAQSIPIKKRKRSKNNTRARAYSWTYNNPDCTGEEWLFYLKTCFTVQPDYIVFQLEQGENETPHFQGFIHFPRQVAFSTLKNKCPAMHIEVSEYDAETNTTYCTKEDGRLSGPWIFGDCPKQGKRNDLAAACSMIDAGKSLVEVARDMPTVYARNAKGLYAYKTMTRPQPASRGFKPKVILYIGPTGTGKTRRAVAEHPMAFVKRMRPMQWDGYIDQETIILDEFTGATSKMELNTLLGLTDWYAMILDVKFMTTYSNAKTIIVTTNIHPRGWYDYKGREEQYNALARRFDEVWQFDVNAEPIRLLGSVLDKFWADIVVPAEPPTVVHSSSVF